jgi:hypothetical protein
MEEPIARNVKYSRLEPEGDMIRVTFVFHEGDCWSELLTVEQVRELRVKILNACLRLKLGSDN